MGPFPHDAPKAKIDADNVAGTDGFEFVEFAHPDPGELEKLFRREMDLHRIMFAMGECLSHLVYLHEAGRLERFDRVLFLKSAKSVSTTF